MTTVGFMLSPLSWWNDLILNLPLAYLFATLLGLFCENCFVPFMIIGYWLTNVIGFILMHHGIKNLMSEKGQKSAHCEFMRDFLISIVYTLAIVFFAQIGWLKFPLEYFK